MPMWFFFHHLKIIIIGVDHNVSILVWLCHTLVVYKRTHTHTHQPVVILHGFISASLAAGTGRTALGYWTNMADTADEESKLKHTLFHSVSSTQTHTLPYSSQQAALLQSLGFQTLIVCSHDNSKPWEMTPNHWQDKTSSLISKNMHSGLELEFKMHSQFNSKWPTAHVYTFSISQSPDIACHSVHWNYLTNFIDWNWFETRNSCN